MKSKILFVFHQNDFDGGASRSLITILERLKKEKSYEILCLLPKEGQISEYLKKIDINYIINPYKWIMLKKNNKIWYLKKILFCILNKYFYYKSYLKLKKYKIDLIYTNTSVIGIGFYLSKKINCKHIFHIREFGKEDHLIEYMYSKQKIKSLLEEKRVEIIVISKALKEKYKKIIPQKNINVIYNGVENTFLKKNYKPLHKKIFLIIGSLNKGKNHLEVLKASEKLLEKKIENFEIWFVGSTKSDYKYELEKYLDKKKLKEKIFFLGQKNKEEIKKIILNSDIGLMPSINEAFGRVTIEYMLGGIPVIASNTGANPELIINNENGFLYELGNICDLSDKMENLINNDYLIGKIGKIGKKVALKNYTSDIYYNNILNLIKNNGE